MPEQSYQTWLSATRALALSEGELLVEAPSAFHVQWLEDKFGRTVEDAARRVLGRPMQVKINLHQELNDFEEVAYLLLILLEETQVIGLTKLAI
jgi:chromosomal replication initiation ATPase DnaA